MKHFGVHRHVKDWYGYVGLSSIATQSKRYVSTRTPYLGSAAHTFEISVYMQGTCSIVVIGDASGQVSSGDTVT